MLKFDDYAFSKNLISWNKRLFEGDGNSLKLNNSLRVV